MSSPSKANAVMVSVIVPTYNRAYCLARTIQSVIDQTFCDWELIIVDNHSTDDTDKLIGGYEDPRIKYLKVHNGGIVAVSRNEGIRAATGKYLAFLDSDDWWAPEKLHNSVDALEAGKDLVYHDLYLMSSGMSKPGVFTKRARARQLDMPVFDDLMFNGNTIFTSSVVVRRDLIESLNGFSESQQLIAAEDYDLWLRFAKVSDHVLRLSGCYGYYAIGPDNLSSAELTIIYIKELQKLYIKELRKAGRGIPSWMVYSLMSASFKIRDFEKAKETARVLIKRRPAMRMFYMAVAVYFVTIAMQRFSPKDR